MALLPAENAFESFAHRTGPVPPLALPIALTGRRQVVYASVLNLLGTGRLFVGTVSLPSSCVLVVTTAAAARHLLSSPRRGALVAWSVLQSFRQALVAVVITGAAVAQ